MPSAEVELALLFRSMTRDGASLAARVAILTGGKEKREFLCIVVGKKTSTYGPGAVTVTVTVAVGVAELATEDELPPGVLYDPA